MRSSIRSLLLVAAVSTPLAALAYGNDEVEVPVHRQDNCDCCTSGTNHMDKHAAVQVYGSPVEK